MEFKKLLVATYPTEANRSTPSYASLEEAVSKLCGYETTVYSREQILRFYALCEKCGGRTNKVWHDAMPYSTPTTGEVLKGEQSLAERFRERVYYPFQQGDRFFNNKD